MFSSEWFELTPPEVHGFFVSKSEVLNARNSSDVAGCFVLQSDLRRVLVWAVVLLWLLHCLAVADRRDVCLRFCGFVVGNEPKEERRSREAAKECRAGFFWRDEIGKRARKAA